MGVHAYFLEPCRRPSYLLPLYIISCEPRSIRLPLESLRPRLAVYFLSFRVLDLGYYQQSEKQLQATGTWHFQEEKHVSSTPLADGGESTYDQDGNRRINFCGRLVYVAPLTNIRHSLLTESSRRIRTQDTLHGRSIFCPFLGANYWL